MPCPYFSERPSVSVRPSPSSHPASRWACGHAECRCLAPFLAMQVTCFLTRQWDMQKIPMQIVPVKLLWRFPSLYMLVHSWILKLFVSTKGWFNFNNWGFQGDWPCFWRSWLEKRSRMQTSGTPLPLGKEIWMVPFPAENFRAQTRLCHSLKSI